jgi:hypothetical protein
LTDATDPDTIAAWNEELAKAQEERTMGNVKAMDVLRGRIAKGASVRMLIL